MNRKKKGFTASLEDFFTPQILLISIVSIIITSTILFLVGYGIVESASSEGTKRLIPELYDWFNESIFSYLDLIPGLTFIMEHHITMMILKGIMFFGFTVLIYYVFFGVYGIVIGFFAGAIIRSIQKKHYPDVELKGMGIFSAIPFYIKTIAVTVFLLVLFSPAYLIPALNLLVFIPIYYFFHKTIVFDVGSEINTRREYKKIKTVNSGELKTQTLACFSATLIPIAGILLYPYYVILVGHYMLRETRELRKIEQFSKI